MDAARPKPEVAGRGRKKTLASKATNPGEGPQSASEVIGYGLKRGWVR